MLKTRVMPILLHKDVGLVKGIRFESARRVGSLMQAIKVYNMRQVDELVFLDITATPGGRPPDFDLVDDFADECFMPLTVGGGIRSITDVQRLLAVGADKIAINTAAVEQPVLISEIADRFGAQCVVVSIDAKRTSDDAWMVYTHSGSRATGVGVVEWAERVVELGAGEILLTSIDRDGTMQGYDVDLIRAVASVVSVPVIAAGGAGNYEHMAEALIHGGASAVAAAAMFHFTEQTPLQAKRALLEHGIPVRT
jgi:imidazole glycerol-phosphate synthase subunit HisF